MKKIWIIIFVLLLGSFSFAWEGAGFPFYADAKVSCSSTGPWFDGPITICTCTKLYFEMEPTRDIDDYQGNLYLEQFSCTWDFGDNNTASGILLTDTSHQYSTSTVSSYNMILTIDDAGYYTNDPASSDTIHINVEPVVNPMVNTSSGDMDLTHQLPFCGTFGLGTVGWIPSMIGSASIYSYPGYVILSAFSTGSYAELSLPINKSINLGQADQLFDQIKVGLSYRPIEPAYEVPGKIEILVYGDTTAFVLPVGMSIEYGEDFSENNFSENHLIQCILSVIPQEFTKVSNVVIRFYGKANTMADNLGVILDQIYLGTGRR